MAKTTKQLLSFAMALIMVLSLIPVTQIEVKAADTSSTTVTMYYYDAAKNGTYTRKVDYAQANAPLEINDPDGDGTGEAYCHVCGATKTWVRVTDALKTKRTENNEEFHYYVDSDITTKATNIDSNGDAANTDSEGSFFWLWLKGGTVCLHIAEGKTLDISTYIHNSGGTLNLMGKGTLVGGTNSFAERGKAICNMGWNAVCNLFGGTIKAKSDSVYTLSTAGGGYWGSVCSYMSIFSDVVVEGKIFTKNGNTNLHGTTVTGDITMIPYYATDKDHVGYVASKVNIYDGTTVGGIAQTGGTINVKNGQISGTVTLSQSTLDTAPVFNMEGGKITGYIGQTGGTFNMKGGAIEKNASYGITVSNVKVGEAYTSAAFNMTGGTVAGQFMITRARDTKFNETHSLMVAAADNLTPVTVNITGGTVTGLGTKAAPYKSSGSCFFLMEGTTLNIGGNAVVNAGYLEVDAAKSYGWGGAIYAKFPMGQTDISKLQTTINISGNAVINCAGDDAQVGARVGGLGYLWGVKAADATNPESHAGKGVKLTMSGGTVNAGRVGDSGGAIYGNGGVVEITGGTITGGRAVTYGGNIYMLGGSSSVSIANAVISNGKTSNTSSNGYTGGGNITLGGNVKMNVTKSEIFGGESSSGGNILTQTGSVVNLNEGAKIYGGTSTVATAPAGGGNLQTSGGTFNINKGAEVYGGTATHGTEIGVIYGGSLVLNGGTVGEKTAANKNVIYLYSAKGSGVSKLKVDDGITYGELETVSDTSLFSLDIRHGVFSTQAVTVIAGDKTVVQNGEGLYEVHNVGAAKNVVDPTCTEGGYTAYTCGYETCTAYKTDATDAHTRTPVAEKPATCLEAGMGAYYLCSCGKFYEDAEATKEIADLSAWEIEQKDHDYVDGVCVNGCEKTPCENGDHNWGEEIPAKDATCIATGNEAYYFCDECEQYAQDVEGEYVITDWSEIELPIDPNTHTGRTDTWNITLGDCGNDGYTGDIHCADCDAELETGDVIPATGEHTVSYKDITDEQHTAYCGECEKWSETVNHTYVEGVCACGAEEPEIAIEGEAVIDGVAYDKLEDAMAAAKEGDEIVLNEDVIVENVLYVKDGVTLNLNGKTLTADNYVVAFFNNSHIVDNSTGNTGRLDVPMEKLRLLESNAQLPVQTSDGIMFVSVESGYSWSETYNCYQTWIETMDGALEAALKAESVEDLGLKFQVVLTWGNGKLIHTFTQNTVDGYMDDWQNLAMNLTVTGGEGIGQISYQTRIVFAEGTETEVVLWATESVSREM